ncbi:hypothetical protein HRS9122_00104 [Pyrenophora teres f. teres]|nr:hypothetical protein HRS9122_00104 [Pyrenophora teres f. teres]
MHLPLILTIIIASASSALARQDPACAGKRNGNPCSPKQGPCSALELPEWCKYSTFTCQPARSGLECAVKSIL